MKYAKYSLFILTLLAASCTKKLDQKPQTGTTAAQLYTSVAGYKSSLAKVYAAFALTGNNGGTGDPDLSTQVIADEGNSDFLRLYFNMQELSTDEAAWSWEGDAGIQGLHEMSWGSTNSIINGLYYRSWFQIVLANDFISQCSDANLASRNLTGASADSIRIFKAEARFLRAYQYWVLMDLFGDPPFVTDAQVVGAYIPKQIKRADLFNYIESDLKGADSTLMAPKTNEYGRADQAAEWALLARMYMNASVYTGVDRSTDVITYCNKIIAAGYGLHTYYPDLTCADNNINTDENIFTINYDGLHTQNYGGTTYLMHGPAGVPSTVSGSNGSWGGLRMTQDFITKFADYSGNTDHRAQFWTSGQTLDMTGLYTSTNGYSTFKFHNLTHTGAAAPDADAAGNYSDIDFPLFRFGEVYLNYAEAVLRGGSGGDLATALSYINKLRDRAYTDASGNINTAGRIASGDLTLNFILDERAREMYYEAIRRTDLIRFGKFTTADYLWAWKGGVVGGTSVSSNYNLFPIPSTDISANQNLTQNPGY